MEIGGVWKSRVSQDENAKTPFRYLVVSSASILLALYTHVPFRHDPTTSGILWSSGSHRENHLPTSFFQPLQTIYLKEVSKIIESFKGFALSQIFPLPKPHQSPIASFLELQIACPADSPHSCTSRTPEPLTPVRLYFDVHTKTSASSSCEAMQPLQGFI